MIRVEREQLDDSGNLIRPSESWLQRASSATEQALAEGAEHKAGALYRDDDLRRALEELFQRKCAYCESRLGTVGPEDVEHYRPHGAVAERRDHPGYYWLAYSWENLYPACIYCNQRRRDRPTWHEPISGPIAGKATSFPLEDESRRALSPEDDLDRERPLLLAPCLPGVDPEQHFRYDTRGEIHPQQPGDIQAQATIQICHLRRRRLRDERARAIRVTLRLSRVLERMLAKLGPDDSDVVELQQMLEQQLASSAPYAGAARYVLRDPVVF